MRHETIASLFLLLSAGCHVNVADDNAPGPDAATVAATEPPAPIDTHPACVISADCPAGQHCDLGECVQDCNVVDPCTGELTCSPRARCIPPGTVDSDPAPVTQHQGVLSAEPSSLSLTERDSTVQIKLKNTSTGEVRYRVQINAPHLSIDEARGTFTGAETTVTLKVNSQSLSGKDVAGSVKIFTSLGNAVVNAPIHVGLTGSYQGSLRYDGNAVPLGDARIALDLIENNSDVIARIDSDNSLLYPAGAGGAVTGSGSYDTTSGLALTVNQVLDKAFGGDRNHFGRPIGRRVRLQVKPDSSGNLQGTFTEQVYGLFTQPVSVDGTVFLEHRACDPTSRTQSCDPQFTTLPDPAMPSIANAPWTGPQVFGWGGACPAAAAASDVETTYYGPLKTAFAQRFTTSTPISNVADDCRAALKLTSAPPPTRLGAPFLACSPAPCSTPRLSRRRSTTA